MLNRVHRNPIDCDMLSIADREQYHATSLARLLFDCRDHPLVAGRINGKLALTSIGPGVSEDHSSAISGRDPYENLPGQDPGVRIVFSTSGSSGTERRFMTSYQEVINNARIHGKGYTVCGVGPEHRVVTFGEVGRFASEFAVIAALDMTGCTIVPIVDRLDVEANVVLFQQHEVNAMIAMPSELLVYLDHWEADQGSKPALRLVVTGGEALSVAVRLRLERLFGPDLKVRGTFQTADAGAIGYQCPYCADGEFHLHEELQLVEILDSDGKPAPEGELVVTNLYRREMPVVRMSTGDRASWVTSSQQSKCGRNSRKIKLLGRTERILKIGGEKTSAQRLSTLGEKMVPSGELVQFLVSRDEAGGDVLTAYAAAFSDKSQALLAKEVLLQDPDIGWLHQKRRIAKIEVSSTPPTRLNCSKKKPKSVVDLREMTALDD